MRLSSPSTVLYNPKAFIAHAASLGQACAHCRRSSTAASRRSLASVSVPVARVVLSHPLSILALVGRYPANKLILREPLPRRDSFPGQNMPSRQIARYYPSVRTAIPDLRAGYLRITAPFATSPEYCYPGFVRLACLIHAANVHSEPGSNPSKVAACGWTPDLRQDQPLGSSFGDNSPRFSAQRLPHTEFEVACKPLKELASRPLPLSGPRPLSQGCVGLRRTHPRF